MELLHCDESVVVCVKPAGLLAVPGRGADKADCLASRLQRMWGDVLVVHRLDQATSGLMVFARGEQAQRRLSRAFAERQVRKAYEAVVEGSMEGEGRVDLPLMADWPRRPLQKVDPAGRPSVTFWRALRAEAGERTRVALEPLTGRSHQLRVHLMSLGHPIVGDRLYAPPSSHASSERLLLHATELAFEHPLDARAMAFGSAAPF